MGSVDPNNIEGPSGYGPQGFVQRELFSYGIEFQNKPTATAPAQVVVVTQQIDSNLDWSTFQLGDIAFGDTVIDVPAGQTSYSTQVDLTATLGIYVDVTAIFNTVTGLATWTFTSIDPTTLDVPSNPLVGFLPPDKVAGEGEGFVNYSIMPKAGATTGTAINAQATVVFDANAPLSTADFLNTLDIGPPTSRVATLPSQSPPTFTVNWSGTDDPGGSGIASYNVYVSDDGGTFTPLSTDTTATSASFTGQVGHTYGFYSVATDNVGNVQATPTAAQATTTIQPATQSTSLSSVSGTGTYGGAATLTANLSAGATGIANETVSFTFNNGVTVTPLGTATTDGNGVATLTGVSLAGLGAGTYTGYVGASFSGDSSYGGSSGTGDLDVAQAALSVTANPASKTYGDADPAFSVSYAGFVTGEGPGNLGGTLQFTTTEPASGYAPVGTYTVTPSGLTSSNYSIAYVGEALTVNPKALTVTASDATRTYGAANPTFTYTLSGFIPGEDATIAGVTGSPVLGTAATQSSDVGTYTITVGAGSLAAANYDFPSANLVNSTLTITPAPLTVTANSATKVYGQSNPAFSASYTGFVLGQDASSLGGTLTVTTSATAASHVQAGGYPITPGGLTSSNYAITFVNGTLTITPAPLTIKADNQSKVYGAPLPALTASYSGFVNGDTPSSLTTLPSLGTTATAGSHVAGGPYSITASGAVDPDYAISYFAGSLTVTPAPLTITASNQTMVYGGPLPTLTTSYAGFVNGDSPANLTTSPTLTTTATASSHVSGNPYSITASGAVDSDYAISYVAGSLTVTPAPLTITANNQAMTYGGTMPALTVSFSGLVNGDTPATLATAPNTAPTTSTVAATSHAGTYAITASGATDADYSISYVAGSLTISPAPLTITASNQTMVYGGPLPTLTASYSGLVNGDSPASLTTPPALSTIATISSPVGGYAITASGAVDPDYTISYVSGTLTVTPAPLTVTDNQTDLYGAPVVLTPTYSGFVLGQSFSTAGISGAPALSTTATATSLVGTYPITVGVGTLSAANYSFTAANGTLTVSPQTAVSATYTGLLYVATASATTSTATVTLSATIKDLSGGAGTITNATVTFVNQADGSTIASNLPVSLINSSDPTTGTASYNWSVNVGTVSSQSYTIGIIVGGDYARNSPADDAVVTVSKPQAGSATGGGYLVNQKTAGLVPGDAGAHTNFGFNAKNNSGGVQGQANIIVRYQGHVYQFQSTSITSLTFPSGNTADYAATGTIQDVTDSSNPATLYTGASLQVTMTDNGSGSSDTIGITILTPGGALWFSSDWNGTSTVEQSLGGGNLQVRPAQELAGAPAAGEISVAPLTLDEIRPVAAEAIALWAAAGIDPRQLSTLSHATFQIDDLTGSDLAWERQGVITLDRTADGYGWFIDSAPGDHSEFVTGAVNSPASGHVDLLSVVAHEMGHMLGYGEDDSNMVTGEYLPLGVRHVPIAIRTAGEAPGLQFAVSARVGSSTSVRLGTTTGSEPLMALDAALAGWFSSQRELAPQDIPASITASSVPPEDGTASIVLPVQGLPRRLIIDPGSADAVIGSGSISSLLGADLTGRPAKKSRPAAFRIPS